MIHSRIICRKVRSRAVFYSTSTSPSGPPQPSSTSSCSEVTTTASPQLESTSANTNSNPSSGMNPSTTTKHKRPFSSVAVYHHFDDVDDHYDNLDLDNFLDNVNRNYDATTHTIKPRYQKQYRDQHLSSHLHGHTLNNLNISTSRNGNATANVLANGSCCYTLNNTNNEPRFPCGSNHHEDELSDLPPPLEEPKYSVHKRVLPAQLTAFSSQQGKRYLMEAFAEGTAESYWKLTEHFVNQSDPAFCGVTTLLMCLNAMCIDPNIRWRGGWRFYGSEDVLLNRCCFSAERIRRQGIVLEDFARLGRCHGLTIDLKRPLVDVDYQDLVRFQDKNNKKNDESNSNSHKKVNEGDRSFSLDDFRRDIRSILSDTKAKHQPILVVSFSRLALGQTGDGHFSPIAAYHDETDQVLVLDVARFKYAPYWVGVEELFHSMSEADSVTNKPRGWFILSPPKNHECMHDEHGEEARRPVEFVPKLGEPEVCPISDIKVHFCKGNLNPVF
uniref:glutathione gamma-glutamylcysteinyltransferase n=1 Tax=Pseudo-nitzschia australis TaxID=44445 RepID=A0A7S4ATG1_9STRA|mmetsp:Transcript_15055/g.30780  ORF Transcript_15055/g.30780 Transcript_15055/m.30780 type:complete len:499 (-) Transcript_15055:32-1528(-)|eukprot:CAMPEP_0168218140 /NCGR_PEP_ID=MMETSP0140_2-20121125/7696_1 /TAXON_ID=44445 /ORGANISM="Pseudo-nitzschia australis, Strain 10249 10 AB" /LENGTH=498 /DNA_ID=CAMNT_0008146091 /DNA_START=140 /DNA_END=1639 /DNA_ORIENTATION=-